METKQAIQAARSLDGASPSIEQAGLEEKHAVRNEEEDDPANTQVAEICTKRTYGGRPSNYKTRLCMKWQQHGECSFANHCNFAHGHEDLRTGGSTAGASAAAANSSSASASKGSHATPQIPPPYPHPPRIDVALHSGDSKGEQQQQQQSADAMVPTAKLPQQQQAEAADQQRQQLQEQALQRAQPHQREQGHRGRNGENRMANDTRAYGFPWNRKTRLCIKWINTGRCPYGDRCNFAHGQHELKLGRANNQAGWEEEAMMQQMFAGGMPDMMAMAGMIPGLQPSYANLPMMAGAMGNPKSSNYKTRICLNWHKNGQCQYAQRCNFAHGHIELRPSFNSFNSFKDMSNFSGDKMHGGFSKGAMRGQNMYPLQMANGNGYAGNAGAPGVQGIMGGPGMQGMPFNGMMMQMPHGGMPAMPDLPHHVMGNMLVSMGGMAMMMDMEQFQQQMGHMNIEGMGTQPGQMPAHAPQPAQRGGVRHAQTANMMTNMGGLAGPQVGMMMAAMGGGGSVPPQTAVS